MTEELELGQRSASGSAGLGVGEGQESGERVCLSCLSSGQQLLPPVARQGRPAPEHGASHNYFLPRQNTLPALTFLSLPDCHQLPPQKGFPSSTGLRLFPALPRFVPEPLTWDGIVACLVPFLSSFPLPCLRIAEVKC